MAKKDKKSLGFNIAAFVNNSDENKLSIPATPEDNTAAPKKRASRKKEDVPIVESIPVPQTSMSYIQENIPYQMAYAETNQQLDNAIQELNVLGAEMMGDLQMVRSSKTMKNKFNIINDMTENTVSIINAKIAAIREKNKSINDINNLEIRRIKELKLQASEEDDNTRIANMYHAFVNYPVGGGVGVLGPNVQDVMMNSAPVQSMPRISVGAYDTAAWEASLDPSGRRMLLEAQNSIETVVVYDESSGNRYYSVIDKQTGQPVPNVETPDDSTIYELDINVRGGYAKDIHRGVTYNLIVINGENASINNY